MALGPVIGGLYMQSFQSTIPGGQGGDLPFLSGQSYDFIFLTAAAPSFVFIILALVLKKSIHQGVAKPSSVNSPTLALTMNPVLSCLCKRCFGFS